MKYGGQEYQITIFTPVNTLGEELDFVARWMGKNGVGVNRAIALIDRNPNPQTETPDERIPFAAVLHYPLPLYDPDDEFMFTKLEFLPKIPTKFRDAYQYAFPLLS